MRNGRDTKLSLHLNDANMLSSELYTSDKMSFTKTKRFFDASLTLLFLIFIGPVMIILWFLLQFDGGHAFYRHKRVGLLGREFDCLKFRTMVVNSDALLDTHLKSNVVARAEWETSRKLTRDPRVTWVGRFMRVTSLDELPQLFNVLSGDMSLVGPRPVVRAELNRFYDPEGRSAYLSVRPGLTGLWQVSGRSDIGYAQRVALDTEYVRSASLRLDAQILIRTVSVVLLQKGAR